MKNIYSSIAFIKKGILSFHILFILGILLTACYSELDEINIDEKQISIVDIPPIHNGKWINFRLLPDSVYFNYMNTLGAISGVDQISNNNVIASLKLTASDGYSTKFNWEGFGSFYISFRIPFGPGNYAYLDNTNSDEFRYNGGKYNIKDTVTIISFSNFSKVGN